MTQSRLRHYMLVSIGLHLLLLWLLRWLPPYQVPELAAPVPIRLLQSPASTPKPSVPTERRATPKPPAPSRPKRGGVLADLPKPPVEARPDDARIVSRYDSRAQDLGPGESGTRKPSGQNPPQRPPELALPERYDGAQQKPARAQPQVQPQRAQPKPTPAVPKPKQAREKPELRPALKPKARRYRLTPEQEVAMLQRDRSASREKHKRPRQALEDHFDRLSRAQPLPTFDTPGVYEQGPERPGEGSANTGGGKFRSVDAYGLKYFSYLIGVEQQIELVFSIPFFEARNRRPRVPIVGFTIQRNGELSEAVLLRSSGYQEVDQALLDAVRRAAPYGPFPEHLPDPSISIRVFLTS